MAIHPSALRAGMLAMRRERQRSGVVGFQPVDRHARNASKGLARRGFECATLYRHRPSKGDCPVWRRSGVAVGGAAIG